jgi:hypothetical protein
MNLPLYPTATVIAIRLALTMLAGGIIGLNRGARARVRFLEPRFFRQTSRDWTTPVRSS